MNGRTMIPGDRATLFLLVAVAAGCNETYIDLTPDGGGDGPADATVLLQPPPCGNGVLDPGEECDDGNRLDGDGCTWECRVGAGDPVGPPDPGAIAFRAEPPVRLAAMAAPPLPGWADPVVVTAMNDFLAAGWYRGADASAGAEATISTRFLGADGAAVREDVLVRPGSGWMSSFLTGAGVGREMLLAWRANEGGGIWRARLTLDDGLVGPPFPVIDAANADLPVLAAGPGRYYLAWYEGNDTRYCVHDGSGPSVVRLRRLTADGSAGAAPPAVTLEEELGAWTAPDIAVGADGTVGVLWWRASTEAGGSCTLRFGAGDEALGVVADGGTIGQGRGGRLVGSDGGFRVAWHNVDGAGDLHLGIAAFDRTGSLLRAPVVTVVPETSLMGEVEVAAGDGGLTLVASLHEASLGLRLRFARTDLFGRFVGRFEDVDPTCTVAAGCRPGAYNVAWAWGGFVVVYFAEVDSGGPEPAVELRMVRLVPVS